MWDAKLDKTGRTSCGAGLAVATDLLCTQIVTDLSIHKTLLISLDTQRAFAVFAHELGDWWPLETHSQGGEKAETAILEGRLGGSMHEVTDAGETEAWATVRRWEPPRRIVLDWHVNPDSRRPISRCVSRPMARALGLTCITAAGRRLAPKRRPRMTSTTSVGTSCWATI
jgi:hypothetical protein